MALMNLADRTPTHSKTSIWKSLLVFCQISVAGIYAFLMFVPSQIDPIVGPGSSLLFEIFGTTLCVIFLIIAIMLQRKRILRSIIIILLFIGGIFAIVRAIDISTREAFWFRLLLAFEGSDVGSNPESISILRSETYYNLCSANLVFVPRSANERSQKAKYFVVKNLRFDADINVNRVSQDFFSVTGCSAE